MKTITFRDMTWPSDEFMKVDCDSSSFDNIEIINCCCQDIKKIGQPIYKNTFIHGSSLGYLSFNRPNEELSFMADLMKAVIAGSTLYRVEAGVDVFLEIGSDTSATKSYIDEIEICGRACLYNVLTKEITVERQGIARIHPGVKADKIVVYGTAIIGSENIGKIKLIPGGKIRFLSKNETYYNIECYKGRTPYKSVDGYICG